MLSYSQEKSLFDNEDHSVWEKISLEKNDSSSIYDGLFDRTNKLASNYQLEDYRSIYRKDAFRKSENSASNNVMPVHEPQGHWKKRSLFPDSSMHFYLLVEPVKER